ncbi:MAG: DUF3301 domain-containing protein [Pseudomonadota bacterium]
MWTAIFLLGLIVFTYLWYINTHIKEQAFALAHAAVAKNGYQLLDDAIGLSQTRIIRQGWSFVLMRTFEFHYADEHDNRRVGQVIRYGQGWLNIEFKSTSAENDDRKVIPFPGTYSHD